MTKPGISWVDSPREKKGHATMRWEREIEKKGLNPDSEERSTDLMPFLHISTIVLRFLFVQVRSLRVRDNIS